MDPKSPPKLTDQQWDQLARHVCPGIRVRAPFWIELHEGVLMEIFPYAAEEWRTGQEAKLRHHVIVKDVLRVQFDAFPKAIVISVFKLEFWLEGRWHRVEDFLTFEENDLLCRKHEALS